MRDNNIRKMTVCAMLAALTCVATLLHIPSPGGYSNLGDGILLVSTFLLGPVCGTVIGAVGSALADLLLGCAYYIPGTIVVKGLSALLAALLFSIGKKASRKWLILRLAASSVPAELLMVFGYWLYKSLILGNPEGALTSVPRNLIQGAIGVIAATVIYSILIQISSIKKVSYYDK